MPRATPPKHHRGTPEITVYGRRAVMEALGAPSVSVTELRVAKETPAEFRKELRAIAPDELEIAAVPLAEVNRLSRDKRNDQGVAARIRLGNIVDLEDVFALGKGRSARTPTRVLALDGLTNPQNIGMTVRSASAAGFDAVLWPTEGVPWINGLIIKSSASTIYGIPIAPCRSLEGSLPEFQSRGFSVCALDMSGSTSVFAYDPPHRCVAVVGSETAGIADSTRALADDLLSIPISERVESLNAAVAAGILCFAMTNRRS